MKLVMVATMMLVMMMLVAASSVSSKKDCRFLFIFWTTACGEIRSTETTEQTIPPRQPDAKPEPDIPKIDPSPEGTGIYR